PAVVRVLCALIHWFLSTNEAAVRALWFVPGIPTVFAGSELVRVTFENTPPRDASSQRSNWPAPGATLSPWIRTVQLPVCGATTGEHVPLSHTWTKTSLSPFAGSRVPVAFTSTAPDVVQTIPE